MFKQFITITCFCLWGSSVLGQLKVGEWRDHLPYHMGYYVSPGIENIYCATENGGIIVYNPFEETTNKLSKAKGLSDIDISAIEFNTSTNTLVIGYKNGNVDLFYPKRNTVFNISDIKTKQLYNSKKINHIDFHDNKAYLSCDFGISVINIRKQEVFETYYIGPNGNQIKVNDISFDDNFIYATTDEGVYKAQKNGSNLIDFNQWQKITTLPLSSAAYSHITHFNNTTFIQTNNKIFFFDQNLNSWEEFNASRYDAFNLQSLNTVDDELFIIYDQGVDIYNNISLSPSKTLSQDLARHATKKNNTLYIAALWSGLNEIKEPSSEKNTLSFNAPSHSQAYSIIAKDDEIWATSGTPSMGFTPDAFYRFHNDLWITYDNHSYSMLENVINPLNGILDPYNSGHIWFTCYGGGLVEFIDNEPANVYNHTNSIVDQIENYGLNFNRTTGLTYDNNGVLWIAQSEVSSPFIAINQENKMIKLKLNNTFFGLHQRVWDIITTSSNIKWAIVENRPKNGIFIFNEGDVIDDAEIQERFLPLYNQDEEMINKPTTLAYDAEKNNVWVGTSEGFLIYHDPYDILNQPDIPLGTQIKIPRKDGTGLADYMLGTNHITSIAVDGANRKWIGTIKSGVYLLDENGENELLHFNKDNSPLLSNVITSIEIQEKTGEIFFATEKGLISYRGDSSVGRSDFENVYTFPNPVRPGYEGLITITGLIKDCNVKITDIRGNIVYETKSKGGMATWNGKSLDGERISTGVYVAFLTNDDGSKTHITKILFIK